MTHKIIDEIGLSRISVALNELKKVKDMPVKRIGKEIDKWTKTIESAIELSRDLYSEQADLIVNKLMEANYEDELEEEEANRIISELEPLI